MADGRNSPGTAAGHVWLTLYVVTTLLGGSLVYSQAAPEAPARPEVVEMRVRGNNAIPVEKIIPHIRSRQGRPFESSVVDEDVRRLYQTRKFVKVQPIVEDVQGGKLVIFEVLERPTLAHVKFVGNEKIKKKTLAKEIAMKAGDPMDPYAVEEGRRKLVEYYHSKGFSKVYIEIAEGNKPNDRGAVYVINEGPKQRVLWTKFEGNTIASDARLRTQIKSKPGILWVFKGEVDRKEIDEDINRLSAYYKAIGFREAEVGHVLEFNEDQNWLVLTYVIHEGPRYQVRDVKIVGNKIFGQPELAEDTKLQAGQFFNQADMVTDASSMQDLYGGEGYVFTEVKPELRYLEERAKLDVVYHVKESPRYRVGKINVAIGGENSHTRITTVLNRMSLRPGDIVDTRELRASERRLKASGLFRVDPAMGVTPKIVFHRPEGDKEDGETAVAERPRRPRGFRGQSPDSDIDQPLTLTILGEWFDAPVPPQNAPPPAEAPTPPAADPATEDTIVRGQSPDAAPVQRLDSAGWVPVQSDPPAAPAAAPATAAPLPPATTIPAAAPVATAPQPTANTTGQLPWRTPTVSAAAPASGGLTRQMAAIAAHRGPELVRGQNTYDGNDGVSVPRLPASSAPPAFAPPAVGPELRAPLAGPPAAGGGGVAPRSTPAYGDMVRPETVVPPGMGTSPGPLVGQPPLLSDPTTLLGRRPDEEPPLYLPLIPELEETQTGRLMLSVGVNSDAGLVGSLVVDEQNFDITRLPRSWEDFASRRAFRGAGQRFRLELAPGTSVQRYTVNWTEPYLMGQPISLGLSGHYYQRHYYEWFESRTGGRIALGRQLGTPDLTTAITYRGEDVRISDPIVPTPTDLTRVLGHNTLHGFRWSLNLDKRDNPYLATEGYTAELGIEQVLGSYSYPRADFEFRKYFMLHERPDRSGRHVLSLNTRMAISADNTPIYDRYFLGGFSTLRGWDYRGASPRDPATGVVVGGNFMLLNSIEYLFPITADDTLRGVFFVDSGASQPSISDWRDRYRVAPGFGLRIAIAAMGPAPIALDFAFPVVKEAGDDTQVFSFFIGFLR